MTRPTQSTDGPQSGAPATAAKLFEVLWDELVSVLGTAAAATLIRRAAKRAAPRAPELQSLQVAREGWEYRYSLPPGWERHPPSEAPGFHELVVTELVPLLREFTGEIVLRRIARLPGFKLPGFGISEER